MNDLRIGHIHIQSAKVINNRCQCTEVYSCIVCNIQVKVGIQHSDRLLCLSVCISCICLRIGFFITESHIQKGITVNRYEFYIFGIIINTCDNDRITVLSAKCHILVTVVNTKQSVCCITG